MRNTKFQKNLKGVQLVFVDTENNAQYVPLTSLQAQLIGTILGFQYDEKSGLYSHYTDNEIFEKVKRLQEENTTESSSDE